MLYDQNDQRLSPVHSKKPNGRRYRYYISASLSKGERDDGSALRLPAKQIEGIVLDRITNLLCGTSRIMEAADLQNLNPYQVSKLKDRATELTVDITSKSSETQRTTLIDLVQRIHISPIQMKLMLRRSAQLPANEVSRTKINDAAKTVITLQYPLQMKRCGVETKLIIGGQALGEPDPELINLIAKARDWYEGLKDGRYSSQLQITAEYSLDKADVSRVLNLAFLSPKIVNTIVAGDHPTDMTVQSLKMSAGNLPADWQDQANLLGVCS